MSTTTITEPCTVHGVRHREGSKVAIACAAAQATSTTPAPVRLAEVTVEHVTDALQVWGGQITYLRLDDDWLVFSGAWTVGDLLVDRHDLVGMLAVYGTPAAVADVLTQDVRWEQEHAA